MESTHRSAHTTIFLVCVGILVIVVAAHSYYRYYVMKDYPFHAFTSCDATQHTCFTADPNNSDPTFQAGTYEKVKIDAAHAPKCLEDHTCTAFTCEGLGGACEITYCSAEALEEGETCSISSP